MKRHVVHASTRSVIAILSPHSDNHTLSCAYDGQAIYSPPFLSLRTDFPDYNAYVFLCIEHIASLADALQGGPPYQTPSGRLTYEAPDGTPPCFLCGHRIAESATRISDGHDGSPLWTCSECRTLLATHLENAVEETATLLGDSL